MPEQVEHRQVHFAVPAVRGRIDQPRQPGPIGQDVPAPEIAVQPGGRFARGVDVHQFDIAGQADALGERHQPVLEVVAVPVVTLRGGELAPSHEEGTGPGQRAESRRPGTMQARQHPTQILLAGGIGAARVDALQHQPSRRLVDDRRNPRSRLGEPAQTGRFQRRRITLDVVHPATPRTRW